MKFLKLTLIAIFSITLLTAVLPSIEAEPTVETSNHDVRKSVVDLAAMIDPDKKKVPSNG